MGRKKLTAKQQEARLAILGDVIHRFGGSCKWSLLHDRGHHLKQVMACVNRGDLGLANAHDFQLTFDVTPAGRSALARKIDEALEFVEGRAD